MVEVLVSRSACALHQLVVVVDVMSTSFDSRPCPIQAVANFPSSSAFASLSRCLSPSPPAVTASVCTMHSAILLSLHPMLPVRVTVARYAVSAFGCRDRASPSSMPAAVMNRIEFSSPTRGGGDVRCCFLSPRLQFAMHRGHRRRAFRTAVQPRVESMEIRLGSVDLRGPSSGPHDLHGR